MNFKKTTYIALILISLGLMSSSIVYGAVDPWTEPSGSVDVGLGTQFYLEWTGDFSSKVDSSNAIITVNFPHTSGFTYAGYEAFAADLTPITFYETGTHNPLSGDVQLSTQDDPFDIDMVPGQLCTFRVKFNAPATPSPDHVFDGNSWFSDGDNPSANEFTYTVNVIADYAVSVDPTISDLTVIQGNPVVHSIDVTNDGDYQDSFTLEYTGDGTPVVDPNPINDLGSSATQTVTVTLTDLDPGANTGTLTVTSVGDGSEQATATINTFIRTVGVDITPATSLEIGPLDQDIVHTFNIENTGNMQDTYDLTQLGGDAGTFSVDPITVDAGNTETFTFTHPFIGGAPADYTKTATIQAESQAQAGVDDGATITSEFKNFDATVTPDLANPDVVLFGNDIVLEFTLENTGGLQDDYTLSTDVGTLNPTSFTNMDPGPLNAETFTLTIASPALGHYTPTIEVTSDGASGVVETVNPVVDVVTVGVTLTPDQTPETILQGNDHTFVITIDNDGSNEDTFNLAVTPGAGDPTPAIEDGLGNPITQITVAEDDSDTFEIVYSAPPAGANTVDVTAESTLDPSATKASDTTTLDLSVITYGVDVVCTSTPLTIRSGQSGSHTFTVENLGNVADTYTLTLTGDLVGVAAYPGSVTVPAGDTRTVTVTLTTPAASPAPYTSNLEAESQGAPTLGGTAIDDDDAVTMVKTYGVSVETTGTGKTLSEKLKVAGGTEVHTFDVTNDGNYEDTFTVTTSGAGDIATIPDPLTIAAGDTETFTVTHDTAAAGIDTDVLTITSTGYSGATATVTAKTFTCEAGKHTQDNSANAAGTFPLDATAAVPFELDLTVTGAVVVDFYQLPSNPRAELSLPQSRAIVFGTFKVDDKAPITTATGIVHYTDEELDDVTAKESSLKVYYWNEVSWVQATDSVLDTANKQVTFTIEDTHWLERSYDYDFVLAANKKSSGGSYVPPPSVTPPEPPTQDEFDDLDPEDAAETIENLDDEEAAKLINGTSTEKASKTLENTDPEKAAKVLEKTDKKKAAEILEQTDSKKAAEIIEKTDSKKAAEIIEETDDDTAAAIVNGTSTRKARQVLTNTTSAKAATVMNKTSTAKVKDIVEDAVQSNTTDKVSTILVETDKKKVADVLLEAETDTSAKVIKEMGKVNLNSAAERVEEAVKKKLGELNEDTKTKYEQKLKDTIENPALTADDLADLFTEIANLPNTPSTVAEIFEIIEVSRTVEVVDAMIVKDKLSEIGLVFSYLTPEKLVEIYTAMTSAAREAVYPYFDVETMGNLPEMTTFSVSAEVSDATVTSGTPVTVTADVENTGEEVGSIEVTLSVNGEVTETETVVLGVGEATSVTWTVTETTPGTYSVDVNGETATFTVEAAPEPAAFETSGLTMTPASVQAGEDVTVSVTVENTGEESGSYTIEVKLDDVVVDSESVTLDGGASTTVSFTVSSETEGSHTVTVDDLSETFTVEAPPAGFPWTTAIIAIIIIAAVAGYLYMQQQKTEE